MRRRGGCIGRERGRRRGRERERVKAWVEVLRGREPFDEMQEDVFFSGLEAIDLSLSRQSLRTEKKERESLSDGIEYES